MENHAPFSSRKREHLFVPETGFGINAGISQARKKKNTNEKKKGINMCPYGETS